jgi:hypothetical protein
MAVGVLETKRNQMIELFRERKQRADFNLLDISSAHGSLESLPHYIKRVRPLIFALYNDITASRARTEPRSAHFPRERTHSTLLHRLDTLIARGNPNLTVLPFHDCHN